jgi:hypothetical protein
MVAHRHVLNASTKPCTQTLVPPTKKEGMKEGRREEKRYSNTNKIKYNKTSLYPCSRGILNDQTTTHMLGTSLYLLQHNSTLVHLEI